MYRTNVATIGALSWNMWSSPGSPAMRGTPWPSPRRRTARWSCCAAATTTRRCRRCAAGSSWASAHTRRPCASPPPRPAGAGCPWRSYGPGGVRRPKPPTCPPARTRSGPRRNCARPSRTSRREIHTRTVEGPAREVLVDASHTADLLVLGTRRHRARLGRVTHTALHRSACPVAVVPHGEVGH
ncbi:universal stress protein [Streptomyces cellulosae]